MPGVLHLPQPTDNDGAVTIPPRDYDRELAKWREWMKAMWTQLAQAYLHQQVWTEVRDAIAERYREADQTFLWSYTRVYAQAQVMMVRRFADTNPTSQSLWVVIDKLERSPGVMSMPRYVEVRARSDDASDVAEAEEEFRRLFGDGGDELDIGMLTRDKDRLRTDLERALTYGDRVVAHFDRRAAVSTLTFKELGDAVEDLARLWTHYEHLLTGSFTSFEHFTITSDWQEPLRDSLFPIKDIDEWFYRQYLNESYS